MGTGTEIVVMGFTAINMHQFDLGAEGEIGGANLKTNNIAYSDPDSVEADLYGVRVDISKDNSLE